MFIFVNCLIIKFTWQPLSWQTRHLNLTITPSNIFKSCLTLLCKWILLPANFTNQYQSIFVLKFCMIRTPSRKKNVISTPVLDLGALLVTFVYRYFTLWAYICLVWCFPRFHLFLWCIIAVYTTEPNLTNT